MIKHNKLRCNKKLPTSCDDLVVAWRRRPDLSVQFLSTDTYSHSDVASFWGFLHSVHMGRSEMRCEMKDRREE